MLTLIALARAPTAVARATATPGHQILVIMKENHSPFQMRAGMPYL